MFRFLFLLICLVLGILSGDSGFTPLQAQEPDQESILKLPRPDSPTAPVPQESGGNPEIVLPLPSRHFTLATDDENLLLPLPGTKRPPAPAKHPPIVRPVRPAGVTDPAADSQGTVTSAPPVPPATPPTQTGNPDDQAPLPVFPKDTSSAVFMVMKTWECTDYDGHTLINHAVGVYGKESEDHFEVTGLDRIAPFKLTLKEDDVTLDELLDAISAKSGLDWGVDISQKTIYLYTRKT